MKIAFVFGGKSAEHEVSVISAMQIINGYTQEENSILPVFLDKNNDFYLVDIKKTELKDFATFPLNEKKFVKVYLRPNSNWLYQAKNNKKVDEIDVCVNICHGGIGENGELVALFDLCNIPISSSDALAMGAGFDKVATKLMLKSSGIDTLDCIWFYRDEWENYPTKIIKELSKFKYPLIIKPARQGSSIGISVAHNARELVKSVKLAFEFDGKVLVERALEKFCEYNCSALGRAEGKIMVSEVDEPKRIHEILSFEDKYISGQKDSFCAGQDHSAQGIKSGQDARSLKMSGSLAGQQRNFLSTGKLVEKIKKQTQQAFKILGLSGVARIDFLFDVKRKRLYLNEINTVPGSLAFYFWSRKDIDINALVGHLVEVAVERSAERYKLTYDCSMKLF